MSEIEIFNGKNSNDKFERVNLYDPTTIMNYGKSVLEKIDRLKDDFSTMDDEYEIDFDMTEKIKKIDFFETVEENEKKKKEAERTKKALNKNFLMKGINSLFKIEEKMQSNVKTYGDLYRSFIENIDSIFYDIAQRRNANIKNVDKTKQFVLVFKQYTQELEEVINIGYEDIESFDKEVIQKLAENDSNLDSTNLKLLKANIEFFKSVLVELKECLASYQNEILEFEMVNRGTMEVVTRQDAFIRRYMSTVRGQGALIISTKRQKDDVDQLDGIKKAINSSIENSAKQISDNIERINKLTCENFIEDKTFKTINDMLKKGVELIESSDMRHSEMLDRRSKTLDLISANMQKYSDSIARFSNPNLKSTPMIESSVNNFDEAGYQKKKTI